MIAVVIGVVTTVVAALLPARKAAKVAPIEALRDTAIEQSSGSRRRTVIGIVLAGIAVALGTQGLANHHIGTVGFGALGAFAALVTLGPVLARPFARLAGGPIGRWRGVPGTLAKESAARSPRRTASAASALMIGIALVAFITVFAASARATIATQVDTAMRSDWIIETRFDGGGLSPSVARDITALPETGAVTALRYVTGEVDGSAVDISGVDASTVDTSMDLGVVAGSMTKLRGNTVALKVEEAKRRGVAVGDTTTVSFVETGAQALRVVAIYSVTEPLGAYTVALDTFDANVSTPTDTYVFVTNADGVSAGATKQAVDRVLSDSPNASLRTQEEFKAAIAGQIDQILNLVYVLLAMALVIALFGIANTLALSVYERTREFGLLRAVGMSRSQTRATVRWESALIALMGAGFGTALGLGISWAMIAASSGSEALVLSIPGVQLSVIVGLAAAAAVGAATVPARRAAKLDVLQAVSTGT